MDYAGEIKSADVLPRDLVGMVMGYCNHVNEQKMQAVIVEMKWVFGRSRRIPTQSIVRDYIHTLIGDGFSGFYWCPIHDFDTTKCKDSTCMHHYLGQVFEKYANSLDTTWDDWQNVIDSYTTHQPGLVGWCIGDRSCLLWQLSKLKYDPRGYPPLSENH